MSTYETVFIATPVLSQQQIKEAVSNFKDVVTNNGGTIVHEEDWGLKKLAYPINKKTSGFYYLIQFESNGELVEKLELQFKRDERILRFLTTKLDKYALVYNERRLKKLNVQKENN